MTLPTAPHDRRHRAAGAARTDARLHQLPSLLQHDRRAGSQSTARTACIARSAIRRPGMRKRVSPASWAVSAGMCSTTTARASSRSPTPTTPTTPSTWPRSMRSTTAAPSGAGSTTQPEFAGLYPGCVPMNIITADGPSAAAYDYLRQSTSWLLTQEMDNVGALHRRRSLGLRPPGGRDRGEPVGRCALVDVRHGERLPAHPTSSTARACACAVRPPAPATGQATRRCVGCRTRTREVDAKNHVYEGALEFNVPLLKEVPGFQDLSTNLAGRWTKYSTFDAVESWKIGLNWQIVDSVRFRSTLSSDIRAPNLNDLFSQRRHLDEFQRPAHRRQLRRACALASARAIHC